MDKPRRHEVILYCAVWTVVFIVPLVVHYVQAVHSQDNMDWHFLFRSWLGTIPYLILFWLHDLLAAPQLLKYRSRSRYAVTAAALLAVFFAVQFATMQGHRPPDEGLFPPTMGPHAGNPPPRPYPVSTEDFIHIMIGLMMCGANIGIKYYFKAQRDEALNMRREQQNLKKELEFLTYQISPHFFMNTLNNILALIDIDPEKAKNTVIELSKMMRFVLYEGGAEAVPLEHELKFLTHYITLMRLRYTDNVDISTDFSTATEDVLIPPLLLVTFVENAFKHGVSYRSPSHIHISVSTDMGFLTFKCVNSRHKEKQDKPHGIGLENVRKRLTLIYGTDFTLIIKPEESTFSVLLTIPTSHDKLYSNG